MEDYQITIHKFSLADCYRVYLFVIIYYLNTVGGLFIYKFTIPWSIYSITAKCWLNVLLPLPIQFRPGFWRFLILRLFLICINLITNLCFPLLAIPSRTTAGRYNAICAGRAATIPSNTGYEWATCCCCCALHASTKLRSISSGATASTTVNLDLTVNLHSCEKAQKYSIFWFRNIFHSKISFGSTFFIWWKIPT